MALTSKPNRRWTNTSLPRYVRSLFLALGLVYVLGAVGFCQWVQREYVRSWQLQRDFWQQVVQLSPDATANWSIIVTGPPAPASKVLATNSWADVLTCRELFSAPLNYVHLGYIGPAAKIHREGSNILWQPEYWGGPIERLDESKSEPSHSYG